MDGILGFEMVQGSVGAGQQLNDRGVGTDAGVAAKGRQKKMRMII